MQPSPPPETCFACKGVLDALARCRSCGCASEVKGYRVTQTLAEHPHARVYLAQSPTGTPVALKELLFSLVPSIEQVEAFSREAAVLERIQHPRTPRFLETFTVGAGVETRLYLAQEFIEGESLATRLTQHPLSSAEFDLYATQVLETLAALHAHTPRIIHRDVKPANLVFRATGELVLVDFGAARQLENDRTHGSTMVGTFGYMPPEQLGGTVDESSDLYALGATLLHAVTGKPPTAFLVDGLTLSFGEVAGLTAHQRRFLARLTAPKRAERFSSAKEALEALRTPPASKAPRTFAIAAGIATVVLAVGLFARQPSAAPVAQPAVPPPATVTTASAQAQAELPTDLALVKERETATRSIWVSEASFFAEKDRYSRDFNETGFSPDVWCPDGARARHVERPRPAEATGCHYLYGVFIDGQGPEGKVTVYARGAIAPVLGKAWVTRFDGPQAGIPQEWAAEQLLTVLAAH